MNPGLLIVYSIFSAIAFFIGIVHVIETNEREIKTFRLFKLLIPTYYLGILISLPFRISIGK